VSKVQKPLLEQTEASGQKAGGLTKLIKVPPDDPFESSKHSIAWAKDHLIELKREMDAFNKDAYAQVVEPDTDGVHEIHKLKLVKTMPRSIAGHTRDIINNLRSALDQAMFALVGKFQYFPIRDSEPEFDKAINRLPKEVPKEIRDLISKFEPYKGGDNLIWALNKLSNTNKHGTISPMAVVTQGMSFTSVSTAGNASFHVPYWDRAKNEMTLARNVRGSEFNMNIQVILFIAIYDVEFVDREAVLAVLNEFVGKVESIVMGIEAESKRIGLL
jgi:hypothetical protein